MYRESPQHIAFAAIDSAYSWVIFFNSETSLHSDIHSFPNLLIKRIQNIIKLLANLIFKLMVAAFNSKHNQ